MASFEVSCELQEEVPVLCVTGYYEKPAGQKVLEEATRQLEAGRRFPVLDLSGCDVLSSPGVSTIVELAIDVMDNYEGQLIICGLDKLKEKVLTLVGIQTMAAVLPSRADAVKTARTKAGT